MKYEYQEILREVYDHTQVLDGNTEYFNELGQQGWELIGLVHVSLRGRTTELGLFYFKREIPD